MTRPTLLVLALVVAAGCGSGGLPVCDVKGKVLFEGKPVSGGDILITDEADTQLASEYLTIDGEFLMKGAPAGPVRVMVRTDNVKSMLDPKTAAMLNKKGAAVVLPDPKVRGNKYVAIPPRYSERGTTDLKLTLRPNTLNEVTLELKK